MSPFIASQPVTLVLWVVTVGAWVLLELAQGLLARGGGVRRDRGSYFLVLLCVAAGWSVTILSAAVPGAMIGGQPIPFVAGMVLAWGGILLRAWAFRTLGRYFTFRVEVGPDQPVVSTGPYRVLRHPGYSALVLILVGLGLVYGTWIGVLAMAVLPAIGLVVRIRVEERALIEELGDRYLEYAAGRKRMIPFVW